MSSEIKGGIFTGILLLGLTMLVTAAWMIGAEMGLVVAGVVTIVVGLIGTISA